MKAFLAYHEPARQRSRLSWGVPAAFQQLCLPLLKQRIPLLLLELQQPLLAALPSLAEQRP